jgi:hypothetical protein
MGANLTGYVHCVRVYETLCKPYLTAQITFFDNENFIENLGIVGGEPVSISFDSPPNTVTYDCNLNVLALSGHQSPNNLKMIIYDMELIGIVYFQDKANIVQHSFFTQGTQAIQAIWGRYLNGDSLNIHRQSDGMMGKNDDRSSIDHKKPFAAIDQIRKYLKFGNPSTPSVLFRDNTSVHLAPIGDLFQTGVTENYVQKETWGAFFPDHRDIYRSIIVAQAEIDKNWMGESQGGRGSMQNIAKTAVQGQQVFDLFKGVPEVMKQAAPVASGQFASGIRGMGSLVAGLINTIPGGLGGAPNIQHTNSNRWERGTAPDTKTIAEQNYAAEVRNGPQLRIKVPLQTGLNATVGQSIWCDLLPPVGDLLNTNLAQHKMSGKWLVKDLCHELYTDKRDVKGTTTMQLIRGGFAT